MLDPARVLVVDDDDSIRRLIADVLRDEGHEVDTARDGVDALNHFAEPPRPELVLLDLMMPHMDGATFVRELERRGLQAGVSIVVISAAMGVAGRAADIGAEAVLGKPFDIDVLVTTVERVLRASG